MINVGNFSGDPKFCYEMGKEAFIKEYKGKFNGDIESLWNLIVSHVEPAEFKPKKNK